MSLEDTSGEEIRTALTVIRGSAQTIGERVERGDHDPEWLKQTIETIVEQTRRIEQAVERLEQKPESAG